MRIKGTLRQVVLSTAAFGLVMLAVVSVDARVRYRLQDLIQGGDGIAFSTRAGELVDALATAVRYQSIENAPLVVFAAAGAVLFIFMLRA